MYKVFDGLNFSKNFTANRATQNHMYGIESWFFFGSKLPFVIMLLLYLASSLIDAVTWQLLVDLMIDPNMLFYCVCLGWGSIQY